MNDILLLDGGLGTMLQQRGLPPGEAPDLLNMRAPEIVKSVHRDYFEAGSRMVMTNTFGANDRKLASSGHTAGEVVARAVQIAKDAAKDYNGLVALDVGPLGELLAPSGTLSFNDAYELFKTQIVAGAKAGADAVQIETMTNLLEVKCALLAAKENSSLPVRCTMSFEANMRTFMGVPLSAMAITLDGLGADAVGLNCSVGPAEMYEMAKELRKWTNLPIIMKPNAGLPELTDGKTVFNVTADEFTLHMERLLDLGVSVVGGCCGTSPAYIKKLAEIIKRREANRAEVLSGGARSFFAVCSGAATVVSDRVRVIGERINPTGKKRFQAALLEGDMDYIMDEAAEQAEAGADILDVNVGFPRIDEKAVMAEAVTSIQSMVNLPLQIDSSNPEVIEAALRVYNGKPIINSVNGDGASLAKILPLAKKYGAAVIGLALDKNGIPKTARERLTIAEKIVNAALEYGIPRADIIIDCLTLTAGAEQESAYAAIEAVALVKEKLGVKTVLGVSNISFGLPARDKLNPVFLTLAMGAGLDFAIVNPNSAEMTDAVCCFHQLKNIDKNSAEYIRRFNAGGTGSGAGGGKNASSVRDLPYFINNGLRDEIKPFVSEMLKTADGLVIVKDLLIPALDAVGRNYETGRIFLPQLLQSAEAAKAAFEVIKKSLPPNSGQGADKILIATVKGDVHDIGKNIVKVVLENYGYNVIDLGRDVDAETITAEIIKENIRLVGLSALMTTTVDSMEKTIAAIRATGRDVTVMAGGAVLTEELAQKIGADYYSPDAMSAVAIARKVFI